MRAARARLALLPCALLVAVAAFQLWLAHTADLTPWLGGGFGMFSTSDVGSARHLHVFVIRPGLEREVALPRSWRERGRRARALPTDGRLRALALDLAQTPTPDHGPPTAVRVQVWRRHFDPRTLVPSSRILRETEFALR